MTARSDVPPWWEEHPLRVAVLLVASVAVAASFTGLWNGFAYDDVLLIPENPSVRFLKAPWAYFLESYWGPVAGEPALYRPVIVLGWAWQWVLGGGAPWLFHAVNILLYTIASVTLLVFLRQIVAHGGALFGAMLFAAHPVHVEAVANVVGQSELLVASLMMGALALYARDRRTGPLRVTTALCIVAMFGVALMTKEHAIVLPALVLATEWAGVRLRFAAHADARRDLLRLVLVLGLVAAAYLLWRGQVLGSVTGDQPHWAMRNRSLVERVAIMTALVPEFVRLLVFPARLYSDYAPGLIPVLPEFGARHIPGLFIVLGLSVGIVHALRRGLGLPVLAAVWFAVTFAPTSNVFFPIGVIMAERTLFLPSVAVVILFAFVTLEASQWSTAKRGVVSAFAIAAILFGTVHSAVRTRVWADNPTLFSTLAVEAPTNFRGLMFVAGMNSSGGRWAAADSIYQLAIAAYPDHVPARMAYARELQVHGEFGRALEQADIALAQDSVVESSVTTRVLSLMHFQRFSDARRDLVRATAAGMGSPTLALLRHVTDSMLAVTDSADVRNRFVRDSLPFDAWTAPLRVRVEPDLKLRLVPPGGVQPAVRSARPAGGAGLEVTP